MFCCCRDEIDYRVRPKIFEPDPINNWAIANRGARFDFHPAVPHVFRENVHMAHKQIKMVVDLSGTLWETPPPEYDRKFTTLLHDFSGEMEFKWIRTHVHLDEHHEEGLKRALTLFTSQLENKVGNKSLRMEHLMNGLYIIFGFKHSHPPRRYN